jgi:hypothetical protein
MLVVVVVDGSSYDMIGLYREPKGKSHFILNVTVSKWQGTKSFTEIRHLSTKFELLTQAPREEQI